MRATATRGARTTYSGVTDGSGSGVTKSRYRALDYQRFAHGEGAYPEPPSKENLDAAWNAWGEEIDRQMEIRR